MTPIFLDWVTYVLWFILLQILRNIPLADYSISQYLDYWDRRIETYLGVHYPGVQLLSWASYEYISISHLAWWFFRLCSLGIVLSTFPIVLERWVDQRVSCMWQFFLALFQPDSLDYQIYSFWSVFGCVPDSVVMQLLDIPLWMRQLYSLIHLPYMIEYFYSPSDPSKRGDLQQYTLSSHHLVYWTRLLYESYMRSTQAVLSWVNIYSLEANIHRS